MVSKLNKKSFSIRELILKGKNAVREYELPEGTVFVRPLSDLEMEEAQTILFDYVKDSATMEYIMRTEQEDLINDVSDEDECEIKPHINPNINYSELYKAEVALMLHIAYMAMRDFTDDEFEESDLKSIRGIKGLVSFVQEISGYSKQSMEDVENFRPE